MAQLTTHERTRAIAALTRKKAQAERLGRWELAALYEQRIQELKAGG